MEIVISSALILTLGYLWMLLDFTRGWQKIDHFVANNPIPPSTSVSIIIAARNEEDNIRLTLDALVAQEYPEHLVEIIVINDHSEDATADIVASFAPKVQLINFIDPTQINSYKKAAIAQAIAKASGKLIITTDADCYMKPNWLRTMVLFYEANSYKMISGPVAYYKEKSWFEKVQSLEFLFLIGMGASTIGNGRPTTCNGANLLYEKSVFLELNGFEGIDAKASGDDELLLHKISAKYPSGIGFLKNKEALVYTYAKPNLNQFIAQRKRWASKSTSYKDKRIILMGIWMWLFNLSLLVGGVFSILQPIYFPIFMGQLAFKMMGEYIFIRTIATFSCRNNLLFYTPILSLLHIIYIIYIGIAGNLGTYKWKGRSVR